ncbi:MAG: PspC family transcriptional regulator [Candidatus Nephrothrix sp. EaCA]|nr:MAG: PspC family transcriptional regulator [Candidatus Nephrothrix sp. EaCA]
MKRVQTFFEEHAFGVCASLAEKLGVATSSIRLFFIYASFFALGSPVVIYLTLALLLKLRREMRRRTVWDY